MTRSREESWKWIGRVADVLSLTQFPYVIASSTAAAVIARFLGEGWGMTALILVCAVIVSGGLNALLTVRKLRALGRLGVLTIKSARYGAQTTFVDVTNAVRQLMHDGSICVKVTNDVLVGDNDPCKGVRKQLTVEYALNDKPATTTVRERERLVLPQ